MKKILAAAILAALPFTALAHGPTPQKVDKSIVIKAAPEKVWGIVKDFSSISQWHPAVDKLKLEKKGNDTFRHLALKDGGSILEKLRSVDDSAMKMRYEIVESTLPLTDYNAFMTVKAGPNAGESTVTWVGRFYRLYKFNPPIPEGQDDATAVKVINSVYDAGLDGLKKLAESK